MSDEQDYQDYLEYQQYLKTQQGTPTATPTPIPSAIQGPSSPEASYSTGNGAALGRFALEMVPGLALNAFLPGSGYLAQGAKFAIGELIGRLAETKFGLRDSPNLEDYVNFSQPWKNPLVTNVVVPGAAGAAFDLAGLARPSFLTNPPRVSTDYAENPLVQEALQMQERRGFLKSAGGESYTADNIPLDSPLAQRNLAIAQKDVANPESFVQRTLGLGADSNAYDSAMRLEFGDKWDTIKATGILTDPSITTAQQLKDAAVNRQAQAARDLISAVAENSGTLVPLTGKIQGAADEIKSLATRLKKSPDTMEMGKALEDQLSKTLGGFWDNQAVATLQKAAPGVPGEYQRLGSIPLSDAIDQNMNLNLYRRNVLGEFSNRAIVQDVKDTVAQAGAKEASLAIKKLQGALKEEISSVNPQVAQHLDNYGAYGTVSDVADKYLQETLAGGADVSGRRAIQSASNEARGLTPQQGIFATKRQLASNLLNTYGEKLGLFSAQPNNALLRHEANLMRDENVMPIIQSGLSLSGKEIPLLQKPSFAQSALDRATSPQSQMLTGVNAMQQILAPNEARGDTFQVPSAVAQPGAVELQGLQALQTMGQNLPPTSDAPFAKELTPPLDPLRPVPNVAVVPRDINRLVPKQIFDLLPQYAAPQDVMPLRIQFQKIMASGDKRQIGQFVSALSMKYPDMPIERGVITGKPSEFQLGNGTTVLLDDADKMSWLDEIRNSSLREDEKALRVAALFPHGTVYPMSVRLNNATIPQPQTPMTPDDLAVQNINQSMIFGPRQSGPNGTSIRID